MTPFDWPDDEKPVANVCGDCNRVFFGNARRIQCRRCAEQRTL